MLCGMARAAPKMIGRILQEGAENNRDVGENTCTDLLMLAFAACRNAGVSSWQPEIGARYSEERRTGADIEWWFVSRDDDSYLRVLVQCKRLYTRAGPSSLHRHRRAATWGYDMLHHESPAGILQAVTLANYARRPLDGFLSWPLYAFFNRSDVPSPVMHRVDGSECGLVEGINLACGYVMEKHLLAKKSAFARRVTALRPWLWSLHDLFCPEAHVRVANASANDMILFLLADATHDATTTVGLAPHPRVIAERLRRMTDNESEQVPHVGRGIPNHVLNDLDQRAAETRTTTGLKRIVFEHRAPSVFVDGRIVWPSEQQE